MHIAVILIVAISSYSGFSYALEKNIISVRDLVDHMVTIGASITAIVGVLITLNSNKRNLYKSLEDAEKKHEESLEEGKKQFRAQMEKIEERNKIEDFYKYLSEIKEELNNIKVPLEENQQPWLEPNTTGIRLLHDIKGRIGPPSINIIQTNKFIERLRQAGTLLELIIRNYKDKRFRTHDLIAHLDELSTILSHTGSLFVNNRESMDLERYVISSQEKEIHQFKVLKISSRGAQQLIEFCGSYIYRVLEVSYIFGGISEYDKKHLQRLIPYIKEFHENIELSDLLIIAHNDGNIEIIDDID